MKFALILFLFSFQHVSDSAPTLQSSVETYPSSLTMQAGPQRQVVIHMTGGDVLMEITDTDGKTLKLMQDGRVLGDLPHDQAADSFWKALAQAFPQKCAAQEKKK